MGKKPVVAFGLLWAGMLIAGCGECCRNTRPKTYNPQPTIQTKTTRQDKDKLGNSQIVPVGGVQEKNPYAEPTKPADTGLNSAPISMQNNPTNPPTFGSAPERTERLSPPTGGFQSHQGAPSISRPAGMSALPPMPQTPRLTSGNPTGNSPMAVTDPVQGAGSNPEVNNPVPPPIASGSNPPVPMPMPMPIASPVPPAPTPNQ